MVLEELSLRLNEVGYKNWLKAGYCLMKLKDGLQGFVDDEMKVFHESLVSSNVTLRRGQSCRKNCRTKGNQVWTTCAFEKSYFIKLRIIYCSNSIAYVLPHVRCYSSIIKL